MSNTRIEFNLSDDLTELLAKNLKTNTRAELEDGSRFSIDAADAGSGSQLANLNWANPIVDVLAGFNPIATATALTIGSKSVSTVTNTHTVPTGVTVGDEIVITWEDGTVMTLTSAFNITVTKDVKVTDTTWVFTNFISILTLVWNGTEWEIK